MQLAGLLGHSTAGSGGAAERPKATMASCCGAHVGGASSSWSSHRPCCRCAGGRHNCCYCSCCASSNGMHRPSTIRGPASEGHTKQVGIVGLLPARAACGLRIATAVSQRRGFWQAPTNACLKRCAVPKHPPQAA